MPRYAALDVITAVHGIENFVGITAADYYCNELSSNKHSVLSISVRCSLLMYACNNLSAALHRAVVLVEISVRVMWYLV